jgi:hypothetical protein
MTTTPWESEAGLAAFIEGFEQGTFPKANWTHQAHVVMAAYYLTGHPVPDATRTIRARIPAYNVAQGGQNTDDSGYHETLTIFWIWVVAGFLASLPDGLSRLERVHATAERFGQERTFHRKFYEHNVVGDVDARRTWVPPPSWR